MEAYYCNTMNQETLLINKQQLFESAANIYSYNSFVQLLQDLLSEGKTTGENQAENYLYYAKLNLQRMLRWDKTFVPDESIVNVVKNIPSQTWWVITEGWCGDSAQNLPAIAKIADASAGNISLKIILRDENPGIMDQHLTNGGRSIPVLVALDKEGNQVFQWGPRPEPALELLTAWKKNPTPVPFDEFELEMHTWYTRDKGRTLQEELLLLTQK